MGSKIDFLFYSPDVEKNLALNNVESLHVVKVLRKRQGDIIQVTDGKGGWFSCEITRPDSKSCEVKIRTSAYDFEKNSKEIHIGIAPTKNSDRIEYFLEKSTEIGLGGVYFIKTKNTYPKRINNERLEKIVVSAMKQSLKAYKPELSELIDFKEFIKTVSAQFEHKYIAHLAENSEDISQIQMYDKMLVIIGPEGDFSEDELKFAHESGFKNITLGKSRLRTETAGVYSVSVLNSRV